MISLEKTVTGLLAVCAVLFTALVGVVLYCWSNVMTDIAEIRSSIKEHDKSLSDLRVQIAVSETNLKNVIERTSGLPPQWFSGRMDDGNVVRYPAPHEMEPQKK